MAGIKKNKLTAGMAKDLIAFLEQETNPGQDWTFNDRRRRQIIDAIRSAVPTRATRRYREATEVLAELVRLKKVKTELENYDRHVHPDSACARDIGAAIAKKRDDYEVDKAFAWERAFIVIGALIGMGSLKP